MQQYSRVIRSSKGGENLVIFISTWYSGPCYSIVASHQFGRLHFLFRVCVRRDALMHPSPQFFFLTGRPGDVFLVIRGDAGAFHGAKEWSDRDETKLSNVT